MANFSKKFNATEYPDQANALLPNGSYLACIVSSEMKPTKSGTGEYLSLTVEILEDTEKVKCKGRKFFDILCLEHSNEQVSSIARGRLASICRAIGVKEIQDSDELHNEPLTIKLGQRERKDNGEMQNYIVSYSLKKKVEVIEETDIDPDEVPF